MAEIEPTLRALEVVEREYPKAHGAYKYQLAQAQTLIFEYYRAMARKGGAARVKGLTRKGRSELASKAAKARWAKPRKASNAKERSIMKTKMPKPIRYEGAGDRSSKPQIIRNGSAPNDPGEPHVVIPAQLIASCGKHWEPVWSDVRLSGSAGSIRAIIFPTPEQAFQHKNKSKDAHVKAGRIVTLGRIPQWCYKKGVKLPPPTYCLLVRARKFARLALANVPMIQFDQLYGEIAYTGVNQTPGRPQKKTR
ncbi:MAG: hypothetical protein ABSH08_07420 [Tepidisphaeraceae bacterium]|jgi:hypothetical protein